MFLLLLGLATGSTATYLGYREYKAQKKRQQMLHYVYYLTTDMRTNESIRDAFLIGAGSTAISIFSVYAALEKHEQVLEVMEYRYPNELMDMTPLEWLNKVETLYDDGDAALNGFISGYSGQAAETITVDQFEAMGATATVFESRTHANDDIAVTIDGETINYSVKSYSDASSFAEAVNSHPESTHYVVNTELYNELEQKGMLETYEANGIEIMVGNYSNISLRQEAEAAFLDIHNAADVADNIPFLSIPLFALRSGFNVKAYREKKQSGNELTINVLGDAGKVGAASGLGWGGAKLGGLIGTAFFPGVGTIIGGGVGAVLGAFAGSKVLDTLKLHFKWGKIIESQERIGNYFISSGHSGYTQLLKELFGHSVLEHKHAKAATLDYKYNAALDLYDDKVLTLPAVLHAMYSEHSKHIRDAILRTSNSVPKKIEDFAESCASKLKKPKAKAAFVGELMLQSDVSNWLQEEAPHLARAIEQYKLESIKNPHHPYQFQMDGNIIIDNIVNETLAEELKPTSTYAFLDYSEKRYKKPIIICFIVMLIAMITFLSRL